MLKAAFSMPLPYSGQNFGVHYRLVERALVFTVVGRMEQWERRHYSIGSWSALGWQHLAAVSL